MSQKIAIIPPLFLLWTSSSVWAGKGNINSALTAKLLKSDGCLFAGTSPGEIPGWSEGGPGGDRGLLSCQSCHVSPGWLTDCSISRDAATLWSSRRPGGRLCLPARGPGQEGGQSVLQGDPGSLQV